MFYKVSNWMSLQKLLSLASALALALSVNMAQANTAPVAKLQQVEGHVEYSKNGKKWRAVTRNKYLFQGYLVRTGRDGSASVVNQATGNARDLSSRSEIRITDSGAEVVRGNLSEPEEAGGSFFQALYNKFMKAQRYTTVRRNLDKTAPGKVSTSRNITVSGSYPDLVWQNAGPGYAYRLTVDDEVYEIPVSSSAEMIRFALPAEVGPGEHKFQVEVLHKGEVVHAPKRASTLKWLTEEEEARYAKAEQDLRAQSGDDDFMLASFQEEHGFLVPAMDTYRQFFQEFPEENEMRPLLIKAYSDLKLMKLKEDEAVNYRALINEEEEG